MTQKEPNNKQLAVLAATLLIPVVATAHLLGLWLPKAFATGISIFVWEFAVYWIPPRPKMSPWRWLIIVSLLSVATTLLITFGLDPFCRK